MTTTPNVSALSDLVQRVRYRSDQENSTFVSDTELEQYIHESYFELFDLIIESEGPTHFWETYTFSTVAGQANYRMLDSEDANGRPLDIYKIIGVDVTVDGYARPIRPFRFPERNRWADDTGGWTDHRSVFYRFVTKINSSGALAGGRQYREVIFQPPPQAVHTVTIQYIPTPIEMSESGTEQRFLHYAHWDEYIVVDAAAKVLEKEESDAQHLYRRKAELRERILWHAGTMNVDDGGAVNDVVGAYDRHNRPWRGEPWS